MATLSGTLYAMFGLGSSGNLTRPNASNGVQGRVQADGFALSDSKNADFSGAGTTVTYNASAIAWAAIDQTSSDIADLNASDHADLSAGIGSNSHGTIDTHLGAANPHSGSAVSGANSDITALSGLTTPLSSDQGGTENAFTKFTGPTTAEKIFTLPDSAETLAYAGGAFHDGFSDHDSNDHIDHSGVDVTAGAGMTGGGTLTATVTLNVINATNGGIGVNADSVQLDINDLAVDTIASGDFLAFEDISGGSDNKLTFANIEATLSHDSLADYAIGQHRVINDSGTGSDELWSASKIDGEISAVAGGVDWQESVLDIVDNTAVPPDETEGNRYILDNTGASDAGWDGADPWDLVQYISGTWVVQYDASTEEGGAAWVEDVNTQYIHNGTSWVILSAIAPHNNLSGLDGGTTSEYYHFTSAQHTEITGWTTGSDISAAEMETLTDDSDAGSLHIHDSDYFTETELGKVTATTGADRIGTIAKTAFGSVTTVEDTLAAINTGWDETNWDLAVGHISANGSSHGYLDQSVVSGSSPAFTSAALTTPIITTKLTFDETTNDLDVTATDQTTGVSTANFPDMGGTTIDVVMRTLAQTLTTKTIALGSNTVSGTKAQFDTACTDDNFGYLGQNNNWTGEQTFDTIIAAGDGGSPEMFGIEIPFSVVNPGGATTAGDLVVMEATGDVTRRTAATQIPIGTARNTAAAGETCSVCVQGKVPCLLKSGDTPTIGTTEVFAEDGGNLYEVTTTVPTTGKVPGPWLYVGTNQILLGITKYFEFET